MVNFFTKIVCIIFFVNTKCFSAHLNINPKYPSPLTINTMPTEMYLEVMVYISTNSDKDYIGNLITNSQKEASIPEEWEAFIIKQLTDKNLNLIEAINKIAGSNLYNFLSNRHVRLFLRGRLLFSFIENMKNWHTKTGAMVLRPKNYEAIERALLLSCKNTMNNILASMKIKTTSEKLGLFMAYSGLNVSFPGLVMVDTALRAAQGAPQQAMWEYVAGNYFYRALNALVFVETQVVNDLPMDDKYFLAQRKVVDVANNGQNMLKKMISDTVKVSIEHLQLEDDRALVSYKLAHLLTLAIMADYDYFRTYTIEAYQIATKKLKRMPNEYVLELVTKVKKHFSQLSEDVRENILIENVMRYLE